MEYKKMYITPEGELEALKGIKAELEKFSYTPTWGEDYYLEVMADNGDYQVSIAPLGDICVKADIPFEGVFCYCVSSLEELLQLLEETPDDN